MDKHLTARITALNIVTTSMLSELIALLPREHLQVLRQRLPIQAQPGGPIDALEPECSQYTAEHFQQYQTLIDNLLAQADRQ